MNWITKIIKAGEKIKTAIHERASKEDIAKSDWTSCCKGPILKKELADNLWVCPDCNRHHGLPMETLWNTTLSRNEHHYPGGDATHESVAWANTQSRTQTTMHQYGYAHLAVQSFQVSSA